MKKLNILLYKSRSNIFPQIGRSEISRWFARDCLPFFLWTGTTIAFFHSSGKVSLSKHDLKIISRGLHIDGPHIFNIRMLILSWPCAFSESKFWIIFRMSSLEKVILDKNLSVLSKRSDNRLLLLLITVHCLAKNDLIFQPSFWNPLQTCFCRTKVE